MGGDPEVGRNCTLSDAATIGHQYGEDTTSPTLGNDCTVRAGSIIYDDVAIGDRFNTGHNALIRELTTIGDDVLVGTQTVIDGTTEIGSGVSLQTGVYVPTDTIIGDDVFIGPRAVLTNDPYPIRKAVEMQGPVIEDHVSIGANATLLPGVSIGEGSFVAAGAIVTKDVPPETLAIGAPATHRPLPESLHGENQIR